jgi:NAD(P)H-dependent FMN reductase
MRAPVHRNSALAPSAERPGRHGGLPCSAQTKETGTLAKYLKSLGVQITEVDLDVESDEDEEDEAGHPLVDDEAQEAVDEDEDDDL